MEIITPKDHVGTLMELCQGRRGEFIDMQFLTETRTTLIYELPLANVRSCIRLHHACMWLCLSSSMAASCAGSVVMPQMAYPPPPLCHLRGTPIAPARRTAVT